MTKWWKCDLQVATPAWDFTMPDTPQFNVSTEDGRRAFAEHYMQALSAKGINLIAVADHNTGEWVDVMVEAGNRAGIVVFPGCEITTGSGADGIHLIIIGERGKTSLDFDRLLAGTLGFGDEHPRFHHHGTERVPGSSGKTLLQILDDLPDGYLVIAPHALNDNGIASRGTVQGDIRWKALHHPRLAAVDPGDCSNTTGNSFNDNFRNRSLTMFPCLKSLAFVSTSDAYSLDDLGTRFCWVRMEEASLEALRQAFLDPEARILCDWDSRLNQFPERDPNRVKHAWLKSLELGGELGNSSSSLSLTFHPGMNVIIGGRGSGKSTAVAAIRQLYSGFATLPQMVRQEAETFSERIFVRAELSAIHCVQNSQEEQRASWTHAAGPMTQPTSGPAVPTNFRIRVVNQKELFERVSHDRGDPLAASRSFLAFVDESLSLLKSDPPQPGSWWRSFEDAISEWMTITRDYQKAKTDLAQLPTVRSRIRNLETQVSAFDSPEAKSRRERNEATFRQRDKLAEKENSLRSFLADVQRLATVQPDVTLAPQQLGSEVSGFAIKLEEIEARIRVELARICEQGGTAIDDWRSEITQSEWHRNVTAAEADERGYLEELRQKGINPDAYAQVKAQLVEHQAIEKSLAAKESKLDLLHERAEASWRKLQDLQQERREKRARLLTDVSQRSGRLKFELRSHRDIIGWTNALRNLLNLRSDAFLEDVPALANWIWNAPDDATRNQRWATWRASLTSGNFADLATRENADLRSTWQKRLESLDETIRLRLAAEAADDIVQISFLRDGGNADRPNDWQDITQGSPGQRTAAMLGFVLHHGDEPLVLDQPEDDLDTEWISRLVVRELRASRWKRQIIVITHNANIPVNGDSERVIVLENKSGALQVRQSTKEIAGVLHRIPHCGAIEITSVREDIQNIMEGGIPAFIQREKKYNNEVKVTSAIST